MSLSANRFYYTNTNHNDASNVLINFHNLTGNAELNEHPLSKYARGIFFSPNYNKQFFDAINWANNLGIYKTQLNLINPFNNSILENLFSNIPSAYPEGMPSNFEGFVDMWEGQTMDESAKRMLIFAPNMYPWPNVAETCEEVFMIESKAGKGLVDKHYDEIFKGIVNSV